MFIPAEQSYQKCERVLEHFERHLDRPWLLKKCCPTIRCQQAQTNLEKFSLAAYAAINRVLIDIEACRRVGISYENRSTVHQMHAVTHGLHTMKLPKLLPHYNMIHPATRQLSLRSTYYGTFKL